MKIPSPWFWPRLALAGLVAFYRYFVSPSLGASCRFEPSCSSYALEALQRHGAMGGSYLTARRVLRCHPGCQGGHDPVPRSLFSFPRYKDKGVRR